VIKQIKRASICLKKLLKISVTAIIPLAALGFSGVAIYIDDVHFKDSLKESQKQSQYAIQQSQYAIQIETERFEELTIPHTQHEEIYDKLNRLDREMENAEAVIRERASLGETTIDLQDILRNAETVRDGADKAWRHKYYGEADKFINEAYDFLAEIPGPPTVPVPAPPPDIVIPPAPAPAMPTVQITWLLLGGVAVAAIIIGIIVWFIAFHEQRERL